MAKQPITSRKTAAAPAPKRTPWPLFVGAAALVLIIFGLAVLMRPEGETASPSGPQGAGAPELTVDRELIDFGEVPVEKVVKATFLLQNTGGDTLRIISQPQVRVVEGCWPPRAVVGSTTLQPGQQTTLTLEFTMHAGMEGPHDFRVDVRTDDPAQPKRELTVLSNWIN